MAVPKKKSSRTRTKRRYAMFVRKTLGDLSSRYQIEHCPQCKEAKLPHHACPTCWTYKGREVVVKKPRAKITKIKA